METLYNNIGMIIGFLSGAFIIQLFFGDKFAEKSILLILFAMIMVNTKEFNKFISNITDSIVGTIATSICDALRNTLNKYIKEINKKLKTNRTILLLKPFI